jgi:hypothetical protein
MVDGGAPQRRGHRLRHRGRRGTRVQPGQPQQLGPPGVPDAGPHALVEQRGADAAARAAQAPHGFGGVGVRAERVGPEEPDQLRHRAGVEHLAGRGRDEVVRDLAGEPQPGARARRRRRVGIAQPQALHPQMHVHGEAGREVVEEVLAVCLHPLQQPAVDAGGVQPPLWGGGREHAAGQVRVLRTRVAVDEMSFGHADTVASEGEPNLP